MILNKDFNTFIKHIRHVVDITKAEEELIAAKLRYRTYLKGQYITQAGDVYKYQTFILQGKTRTFYLDSEGNEHIISFGIENWWVGDLCSFSTQSPAEYNTECLEKTKVVQITYDSIEELYESVPILERYFRIIVQRAYANMSKRIVRNHSLSARERYLLFNEEYSEIAQRVPQYMVASYLGITKEFLSNIRKQLSQKPKS